MRFKIVIYVLLVVLLVLIAYYAIIGFTEPVPDADDNLPPNTDYDYYVTFRIAVHIISQGTDGQELASYVGKIETVTPTIAAFESMDKGKVYETDKLLSAHPQPGTIYGSFWVTVEVTGPGGYVANWKSSSYAVIGHKATDPQYLDQGTGRFLMKEAGSYQVNVVLYSTTGPNDIAYYLDRYTGPVVVE